MLFEFDIMSSCQTKHSAHGRDTPIADALSTCRRGYDTPGCLVDFHHEIRIEQRIFVHAIFRITARIAHHPRSVQ